MQKSILLTGAAGFLGREVLRQLIQLRMTNSDIAVPTFHAIDNYDPMCGSSEDVEGVEFYDINGDLPFSPTHIIHLAAIGRNLTCARDPYKAFHVNVDGTQKMLELARRNNAKIILCSSNIVLSDQDTIYRRSKRECEELARNYDRHGVEVMVLRPSNIAGKGQSRREFQPCAFASMDMCFEKNGYIEITGDGTQQRDFVNVKDVARAFVMALDNFTSGATLDICTGNLVSMLDVMKALEAPFEFVAPRPGDAKVLVSDPKPGRELLGFKAAIDIQQTIEESFPSVMSAKASHTR